MDGKCLCNVFNGGVVLKVLRIRVGGCWQRRNRDVGRTKQARKMFLRFATDEWRCTYFFPRRNVRHYDTAAFRREGWPEHERLGKRRRESQCGFSLRLRRAPSPPRCEVVGLLSTRIDAGIHVGRLPA